MYHLDVLPAPSLRTTILGALNGSLMVGRISHAADPFDDLTSGDIDILSRFHTRTIPTLETSNTHGLYQAEILALTGQVCKPPPPRPVQGYRTLTSLLGRRSTPSSCTSP